MKPFRAPLDDILFSLNEVAEARQIPDWDADLAAALGSHFAAFAEAQIAPLDEAGDLQGCRLEAGRVRMPDGFREAYAAYAEKGWPGLTVPEAFGGQGMGAAMLAVVSEIFSGACHSLQMVTGLVPGAVRTLLRFGSDDQKARLIPPLAAGSWLATMCLTEPEAGSDLSRVSCAAEAAGGGWRITGEKIFISGGDQDMSNGILHLVLARTGSEGVKGLSLFACPSEKADGTRNAVAALRVEEKMGLHASPTCHLRFEGAEAELIGQPGGGLQAMFTMMNHARLDVALQGVAHAARAHDVATAYAAGRVQGRGAEGVPVTLDSHADVRRMLDEMDRLAIGGRALAHIALVIMETGENPDLVDFLTPLAKAFCTEAGIRAADLGIQVLGGYGYLREYRLEQTYRDARVTSIYEGTNGIHALSLVTRLLRHRNGVAFDAFSDHVTREVTRFRSEALARAFAAWREARADLSTRTDPSPAASAFLSLTAEVTQQAVWARIGAAADRSATPDRFRRLADQVAARAALAEADLAAMRNA